MRPTKLTANLLEAFRAVLADELAAIAFTEEELVWQANQRLQPDEQITYRTYQRYKAFFETQDVRHKTQDAWFEAQDEGNVIMSGVEGYMAKDLLQEVLQPSLPLQNGEEHEANAELVAKMYNTFKGALLQQKLALVRGIHEGAPNWRRFAWMLERKFPDFNMKTIAPASAKPAAEATPAPTTLADAVPARLKAAQKVPEKMEDKWQLYIPMKPFDNDKSWTVEAETLYTIEEGIAYYECLGMDNPYKHLGYQEAEMHDAGQFRFYGMGPGRLPLRQYCPPKGTFPTLTAEEKERLWAVQQANNQRASAA